MSRPISHTGHVLALAASAGVFALWSAPAAAQATWNPSPTDQSTFSSDDVGENIFSAVIGAPRSIDVGLSARAQYDSNIARGSDAVSGIRHLHKDDVTYTPTATVDIVQPIGKQAVFLNGSAGYDFHQYNTNLDTSRINVLGGLQGRLGLCGGELSAGYSRRLSDQADLPLETIENVQTQDTVGAQVNCETRRGFGASLSTQYSTINNSAEQGVVDSDTLSVNGQLSYSRPRLGTVSLISSYSTTSYDHDEMSPFPAQPKFGSYNFGVQYARPIGTRLKGSAQLSYQIIDIQGRSGGYTGLAGNAELNYRVNHRLTLDLLYNRSVTPTIQQGSDYDLIESVQGQGRYVLSSRLQATFGARWGRTNYTGRLVQLPGAVNEDELWALFGGMRLSVGRSGYLAVDVRRDVRNTNLTVFNYTAYRVGVTAGKTF